MHFPLSNDHDTNLAYQGELTRANEVIGQFIRSCSHGMRGPIKSIMGLVNIMTSAAPEADINLKMLLGLVEKVANNMESQLDEMEHFLENSTRQVNSQVIDWNELVGNVLARNRREIEKAQVVVSVDIQAVATFWCDKPRLILILDNLVTNAIQFRDPQKSKMEISLQVRAGMKECVITLSDNGIGIEEKYHKKIFELFFRGSERSSGTGMGLFVVQEALKKIGGEVAVESKPGRGTQFAIRLPGNAG